MFLGPPLPYKLTRPPQKFQNLFLRACSSVAAENPPNNLRLRSSTRNRNVVKRKLALLVGYNGANYHGIQRNQGVETISDVIEHALHSAGAISDDNFGFLEKIQWQTSARTDRGVSAAGNFISAKLLLQKEELAAGTAIEKTTERINDALPGGVVLFAMKQVTTSFSAKNCCEERWYEYMLPMAAIPGGKSLHLFNDILKQYEGSHLFHNFTVGLNHSLPPTPQARRYIKSVTCDLEPVFINGSVESDEWKDGWVRIRVRGQSFVLHQIRKMISLAWLIFNGQAPEDAIERSFCRQTQINVPPAPSEGLFLDCCHFHLYNKRHAKALPEPILVSDYDTAREKFKQDYIFPSLAKRFASEDSFLMYTKTAEKHPITFS